MRTKEIALAFGIVLLVAYVHAGCEDSASSGDGEVKAWFKDLGCKIKKGAEDLQESAKPWTDKIGSAAKDIGSSVSQTFDELKHKLTDSENPTSGATNQQAHIDAPTEKVPLAPLGGNADAGIGAGAGFGAGNGPVMPAASSFSAVPAPDGPAAASGKVTDA